MINYNLSKTAVTVIILLELGIIGGQLMTQQTIQDFTTLQSMGSVTPFATCQWSYGNQSVRIYVGNSGGAPYSIDYFDFKEKAISNAVNIPPEIVASGGNKVLQFPAASKPNAVYMRWDAGNFSTIDPHIGENIGSQSYNRCDEVGDPSYLPNRKTIRYRKTF